MKPASESPGSARVSRARLGAQYLGGRSCRFGVWAPRRETVEVRLVHPYEKVVPLARGERGYFSGVVENVQPGVRYLLRLDGKLELPDPASRHQPIGALKASEVTDPAFDWKDGFWCGLPLQDYVIYELHVGTFTPEGTFAAAAARLRELKELGITAIELMPIAQFPGDRNWGYDGIFPYAVQASYGGPQGLKVFVDECHRIGLAVVLDVVYNHLGPEGGFVAEFGPFFSDRYRTPWGAVLNFDGAESDAVRRFFIDNALYWIEEFHFDALRLDAVSAIVDNSATHFLEELAEDMHRFGRAANKLVYAIAETSKNDARTVRQRELGGHGLDAQWSFDFHHALHALLTGEKSGYYQDFGSVALLAAVYAQGYAYTGQYSPYYKRAHGSSPDRIPGRRFVAYCQNHDEAGNRPRGDRFGTLLSFEAQKLAAGTVLLSPFVPMLFMGEEYGEKAPFEFFTSHSDPGLTEAVRAGRRREAADFGWTGIPGDPDAADTFERSKLNWGLRSEGKHFTLRELYRELLRLRRELRALAALDKERTSAKALEQDKTLYVLRAEESSRDAFAVFCFGDMPVRVALPVSEGNWRKVLDSSDDRWQGPGGRAAASLSVVAGGAELELNPKAFVLYERVLT